MWRNESAYFWMLPSILILSVIITHCAGENLVPEPADEAQEAAEESAGRAEDARRAGAIRGQLERERTEREERRGAEARTGTGLVHVGGKRRRRGYRGRHLLPGSSTIVGCGGFSATVNVL